MLKPQSFPLLSQERSRQRVGYLLRDPHYSKSVVVGSVALGQDWEGCRKVMAASSVSLEAMALSLPQHCTPRAAVTGDL